MAAHVAILKTRYIRLILSGRKTVESRLTRTARPPFQAIEPGERIFFKASSGPYMATAVADKIYFQDQLTPAEVDRLKTHFNSCVCGEDEYWQLKRDSRYATFILLRDVQATRVGPRMEPSRGLAWFVIDEADAPAVFDVPVTAGALRNGYLRVARKLHIFDAACYGGLTAEQAGEAVQFVLPDGRVIYSDIVSNGMVRWRGWRGVYDTARLDVGDIVRFIQEGPRCYRLVAVKPYNPGHDGSRSQRVRRSESRT